MSIDSTRLEQLLKREAALRAEISQERSRRQRRDERNRRKLVAIVGATLLDQAAKSADFDLMVKGVLKSAVTGEAARFLKKIGYF